jgi:hypothetical protein
MAVIMRGAAAETAAPFSCVATNEETLDYQRTNRVVEKHFSEAQKRAGDLEHAVAEVLARYEDACNHGATSVADVCMALGFPLALTNDVIDRTSKISGSQISKIALRREIELAFRRYFNQVGPVPCSTTAHAASDAPTPTPTSTKPKRKEHRSAKAPELPSSSQEQLVLRSVVHTFGLNTPRQVAEL